MKSSIVTIILLLFFLLSSVPKISAQTKTKPNTIYLELGGNGLFTSINYERQILKNIPLHFHAGAGIYGLKTSYLTIPIGINYLLKLNDFNAYLDLGFGATYSKADVDLYAMVEHSRTNYKNTNYWNYIPSLGYRKLTKRNLVYRFSFTPVINHNDF